MSELVIDLDAAARILRDKLFAPLGVTAPEWPILKSVPEEWGVPPWLVVRGAAEHVTKVIVINLKEFPSKLEASATLAHEMAHTIIGPADGTYDMYNDPMAGHGPKWQELIAKVGLEMTGRGSTTRPTPKFEKFFHEHLEGCI